MENVLARRILFDHLTLPQKGRLSKGIPEKGLAKRSRFEVGIVTVLEILEDLGVARVLAD